MMNYKYLIGLLFALLFFACDDLTDKENNREEGGGGNGTVTETGTAGIYVLSEGLFNLNNSTLAYHSKAGKRTLTISAVSIDADWVILPTTWLSMAISSTSL